MGVDFGATGATVFSALPVGWCGYLPEDRTVVFPEDWSLAERRAWVGLVFIALIVVATAVNFSGALPASRCAGRPDANPASHISSVHHRDGLIAWAGWRRAIVRAEGGGPVEHDERDLRLALSGRPAGDWALTSS